MSSSKRVGPDAVRMLIKAQYFCSSLLWCIARRRSGRHSCIGAVGHPEEFARAISVPFLKILGRDESKNSEEMAGRDLVQSFSASTSFIWSFRQHGIALVFVSFPSSFKDSRTHLHQRGVQWYRRPTNADTVIVAAGGSLGGMDKGIIAIGCAVVLCPRETKLTVFLAQHHLQQGDISAISLLPGIFSRPTTLRTTRTRTAQQLGCNCSCTKSLVTKTHPKLKFQDDIQAATGTPLIVIHSKHVLDHRFQNRQGTVRVNISLPDPILSSSGAMPANSFGRNGDLCLVEVPPGVSPKSRSTKALSLPRQYKKPSTEGVNSKPSIERDKVSHYSLVLKKPAVMYLAKITSATVLLLQITPALAVYACCAINDKFQPTRRTGFTETCCRGTWNPDYGWCTSSVSGQRKAFISCCTASGTRKSMKTCNGGCEVDRCKILPLRTFPCAFLVSNSALNQLHPPLRQQLSVVGSDRHGAKNLVAGLFNRQVPHVVSFFADASFHGHNSTINFPTNCCVRLNDIAEAKDKISSFDTTDSYCTLYSTVDYKEAGTRNGWPTGWMQLSGRRNRHVIKDGKIQYKADGKPEMKPWNDKILIVKCEVGDP
ncbi:hypothetical protein E2P81_ATG02367 [Venturia nashicola]|uniref:Uncharacterized protein n=1 Tax=Venturia nashicola TaxID=86259 RepID=A0A4Z1P513_9PEZI|nr:hypothetical protein E6O75_ATG02428 [Venturia nashicola]TLD36585.1 hypothetical protein E2P81_ATG02367 [Venturia nashicola]